MPRLGTITLYIDPKAYRDETGDRLTKRTLDEIGRMVNEDSASICGYEAWATKFVNVPERRTHDPSRSNRPQGQPRRRLGRRGLKQED